MWQKSESNKKYVIPIILSILLISFCVFSYVSLSCLNENTNTYTKTNLEIAIISWISIICFFILLTIILYSQSNKKQKSDINLTALTHEHKDKNLDVSKMPGLFRTLFDDLSELAYISDLKTYDLLYINEAGKKSFHVGDDLTGKKCYEVLQHRTSPCEFCNSNSLKLNESYTWEATNAVTNRHYLLKDCLVEWEQYPVRLEMAFDITETENEKVELKNMLSAEKMLMECVRVLYEESSFENAINLVLEELGTYLSAERAYIFENKGSASYNTFEWCKDPAMTQIDNLQEIPMLTIHRWLKIFEEGECVTIINLESIKDTEPEEYLALSKQGIKSLVAVPLDQNGEILGFVGVDNPLADKLTNIASYLKTLRYFIMNAYQRFESEKKLSTLSYLDNLTSFHNRNRFMDDLESFASYHESIGVVDLDLNGLKEINDYYGHHFGDNILIEFSKTLRSCFSNCDLYRIGGDEFVVLCKNKSEEEFYSLISQLKQDLKRTPHCKAAIGSQWVKENLNINDIIVEVEKRMYENKKEFYHDTIKPSSRYRHHRDEALALTDLTVLKEELAKQKFVVYLQPIISSADRTLAGAEALIRYFPSPNTLLMPNDFLPLLEDTQLINFLDIYVFEQVCIQLRKWLDEDMPLVPISVNFSRYTLSDPTILNQMNEFCSQYEIDKKYLDIEIIEGNSGLLNTDVQHIITKMREAGFSMSIDDFGTQYANIALLASVEIDILKLDKSIIDNIETNNKNRLIVKSVADYCNELNITIVAEGVENENQFKILKSFDIHLIQGYLFSRPIPIKEFEFTYFNNLQK